MKECLGGHPSHSPITSVDIVPCPLICVWLIQITKMCYPFLHKRPQFCRYKLCLFLVDFLPFIYFGEKPNKMLQLSTTDTHHELGAHTPEPKPGFQFFLPLLVVLSWKIMQHLCTSVSWFADGDNNSASLVELLWVKMREYTYRIGKRSWHEVLAMIRYYYYS